MGAFKKEVTQLNKDHHTWQFRVFCVVYDIKYRTSCFTNKLILYKARLIIMDNT